jgi:hypothetical protein
MADFLQEFKWATGANGWGNFTQTDTTRFSNSGTAPTYMAQYGTFRGDSAGNTSGVEQSARIGAFSGGTLAAASFAFRLRRMQLSGSNGFAGTLNTHRDFLCWAKCLTSGSSNVSDGGSPAGAPFKIAVYKTSQTGAANTGAVFLEFAASGQSAGRDPLNGLGFDGYVGHWLGMEFTLELRRWLNNAQNAFACTARIFNLESRRPRPIITMAIKSELGDPTLFTTAFHTNDIVLGGNKLRTTSGVDDEIDVDYDEFRGAKAQVGFPRLLYGGEFRVQTFLDKYDPVGNVQDFSHRYVLNTDRVQDLTCNYREHFLETDASVTISDPGIYRLDLGQTIAGGGQTASLFATNMSWATAPLYFKYAKNGNCWLKFTTGALAGQERRVTSWNNSIFYISVEPAFSATPAVGDKFQIQHRSTIVEDLLSAPRADTQYRLQVIGTDHGFRAPIVDLVTGWDELGPVWWSGFLDTIEATENPSSKGVRLRAYGVSDFLKKSRSIYKVSRKGESLDTFQTMKQQFEDYDPCIDLTLEAIDNAGAGVRLPFECFGEDASEVQGSVARMIGNFVFGVETNAFPPVVLGDFGFGADYRFRVFENRDDKDDAAKVSFNVRTVSTLSPRARQISFIKADEGYANKWKFEGASFVNEIITILTHRARRDDALGKPAGFTSIPFLQNVQMEFGTQGSPVTGSEIYPATFVGWQVEIIDLINRVGFRNEDTGDFVYEGGSKRLKGDLSGRRVRTIYEWMTVANQMDFRTTRNFPGAISGFEVMNNLTEAHILRLTPNGRPIERILGNSKSMALLGARLKIIQSADVIGWLQAGIAAQIDNFASVRQRYSGRVVEHSMRERPDANNNRVAIATPEIQMIRWGTTANGGDGLKVGARNPATGTSFGVRQKFKVGMTRLGSVRGLSLKLNRGGWLAEWSLASMVVSAPDVIARFAASAKTPGR